MNRAVRKAPEKTPRIVTGLLRLWRSRGCYPLSPVCYSRVVVRNPSSAYVPLNKEDRMRNIIKATIISIALPLATPLAAGAMTGDTGTTGGAGTVAERS